MKGFSKKEMQMLIDEAMHADKMGRSLTTVFKTVADKTGRAKGSVRNYYYSLMKNNKGQNEAIEKSGLKVDKIVGFSQEEEIKLVKDVLSGVKQGKSVRRAIIDLSCGDNKQELRIQNKYRNLLKNKPELIKKISNELQIKRKINKVDDKTLDFNPLVKKVSFEIDNLIERIKNKYKAENERLIKENVKLKSLVEDLSYKLGVTPATIFFNEKINKKTVL